MAQRDSGPARIARRGMLGVAGLVLLMASGCSIEDFFGLPDSTGGTHATPGATATRERPTPIPTNTPWVYVTATPTPTSTPAPRPSPTPTVRPTPSPTPAPVLLPLLPTADDLPDGLEQTGEDAALTAREAAAGFADADRLAERLVALGYAGGAYREFALPNPGITDFVTRMLGFQATVMRFDTAAHASEAIVFQRAFAKEQAEWDLDDAAVERIGDESAALTGFAVYDGVDVKVVVVFVRDGALVYRFIAISGVHDTFADTVAIARETV